MKSINKELLYHMVAEAWHPIQDYIDEIEDIIEDEDDPKLIEKLQKVQTSISIAEATIYQILKEF